MDNKLYKEKLYDPRWYEKKAAILKRDAYKCAVCGYRKRLQIHHRQYIFNVTTEEYIDPWNYDDKLLVTLCAWCHKKGHKVFKIPVKKIF